METSGFVSDSFTASWRPLGNQWISVRIPLQSRNLPIRKSLILLMFSTWHAPCIVSCATRCFPRVALRPSWSREVCPHASCEG